MGPLLLAILKHLRCTAVSVAIRHKVNGRFFQRFSWDVGGWDVQRVKEFG